MIGKRSDPENLGFTDARREIGLALHSPISRLPPEVRTSEARETLTHKVAIVVALLGAFLVGV